MEYKGYYIYQELNGSFCAYDKKSVPVIEHQDSEQGCIDFIEDFLI